MAKILVVDDDKSIRTFYALALKQHEVITAIDAVDAVKELGKTSGVNLIISDLEMPGGSGAELHTAIKHNPIWKDIPFLLISGNELDGSVTAKERGMSGFLLKPVSPRTLREKVSYLPSK